MNDQEIIKALECCTSIAACSECPYDELQAPDCNETMLKDVLDLIKRQKERMDEIIEQLENTKEKCSQAYNAAIFTYTRFEYKGAISGLAHAIAILKGVQNE